MLTSKCVHCVHNKETEDFLPFSENPKITLPKKCVNCTTIAVDNFLSKEEFYPLELAGTHIRLWNESGKSKITIAYFTHLESTEGPDLIFVGERPMNNRVDWINFKTLIAIGYENYPPAEEE